MSSEEFSSTSAALNRNSQSPNPTEGRVAAASLPQSLDERLSESLVEARRRSLTIGQLLRSCNATVSTAESCTGGLVSAIFTDVPGSSEYFLGGVVSYANSIKEQLLGVRRETLIAHGAVSEACVREMAAGVRERLGTTFGVAISGIAGPSGGTPEKPVGTVHFAVASPKSCLTEKIVFAGDRDQIRQASVLAALRLLEQAVSASESR